MPVKKSRKNVRIPAVVKKGSSADFQGNHCDYRKLASIVNVSEPTIRRIAEQDLRYKSYTLKIRQMLSEAARTSQVARLPFWSPNSPDLNPLDYYVIERVTNMSRHPNVTSLRIAIKVAFVGMDSATLQHACERFKPRIEAIQANGGYIE